jgi:pimeloyl-ACP methyl ester carboxylesterase
MTLKQLAPGRVHRAFGGACTMKASSAFAGLICVALFAPAAQAACKQGAYASDHGDFVVVGPLPDSQSPGQRYLFRDGRRGSTADNDAAVTCVDDAVTIRKSDGAVERWEQIPLTATDTHFSSVETKLVGRLIEPSGAVASGRPLVVMVHGSERTSSLNSPYAYSLAAQGISVFVYDKRGTGASEGDYTQNFELLASDAAAALAHARTMARGRFGRSGYFGGSQGGWVAPLAVTRSDADFVAIGFGLVASPIEEDREQMISEARALGLDSEALALINRMSAATSRLLLSGFTEGYKEVAQVRRELAKTSWSQRIHGEYSGEMLRVSEDELRRIGRARFDNLELIWNYDAVAALKRVNIPVLWILASEDREAPIQTSRTALLGLMKAGKPIEVYLFPDTDHGMVEFATNADGSRTVTRITDGYLRLLGDWIQGRAVGTYGRAQKLDGR